MYGASNLSASSELPVGTLACEGVEIAGVVESRGVEGAGVRRQRRPAHVGREQLASGAGAHDAEPGVRGVHPGAGDRQPADQGPVLGGSSRSSRRPRSCGAAARSSARARAASATIHAARSPAAARRRGWGRPDPPFRCRRSTASSASGRRGCPRGGRGCRPETARRAGGSPRRLPAPRVLRRTTEAPPDRPISAGVRRPAPPARYHGT